MNRPTAAQVDSHTERGKMMQHSIDGISDFASRVTTFTEEIGGKSAEVTTMGGGPIGTHFGINADVAGDGKSQVLTNAREAYGDTVEIRIQNVYVRMSPEQFRSLKRDMNALDV